MRKEVAELGPCKDLRQKTEEIYEKAKTAETKSSREYVIDLMRKKHLFTPYAVAKYLGIRPASVYRYLEVEGHFDDYTALLVAKELEIDPMEIIAAANAQRAKKKEQKKEWENLYKKMSGAAATLFLITAPLLDAIREAGVSIM